MEIIPYDAHPHLHLVVAAYIGVSYLYVNVIMCSSEDTDGWEAGDEMGTAQFNFSSAVNLAAISRNGTNTAESAETETDRGFSRKTTACICRHMLLKKQ